jgi:hypothetical protein
MPEKKKSFMEMVRTATFERQNFEGATGLSIYEKPEMKKIQDAIVSAAMKTEDKSKLSNTYPSS